MMARPQYYAEMGKPTPKTEVMRYLKVKRYVDAKDFAGECEDVVVVARGQAAKVRSITIQMGRNPAQKKLRFQSQSESAVGSASCYFY